MKIKRRLDFISFFVSFQAEECSSFQALLVRPETEIKSLNIKQGGFASGVPAPAGRMADHMISGSFKTLKVI